MEGSAEAHIIKQQRFASELQYERSTVKALQDELGKVRASNKEIHQRAEADYLRAGQQAEHLKAELEKDKSQMHSFQAEQDLLRLQMMEEMRGLHKSAAEEKPAYLESLSDALPASEPVETELSEETPKKKKSSIWKKIRQHLGLRRRKKQPHD
ncbi:unnamed protein product [Pleuronectes platessa]|uniref:Uncharacterized protein n=1 Tax=Pleuronectes platessa TaxID=8262 RepID=A0A9N7UE25_PLEPL|nr:unnamed protein product [Pleuronectes platessa]